MKLTSLLFTLSICLFSFAQEDEEVIVEKHITIELESGKKIIVQPGDQLKYTGNSGYTNVYHQLADSKIETEYKAGEIKELTIQINDDISKYHPYKGEGLMKVLLKTEYKTESTHLLSNMFGFVYISLKDSKPTAFTPQADELTRRLVCLPVKKKYSKYEGPFGIDKMIEILDYYEETCGK